MCRKEMAKRGLTDEDVLSRVAVVTNRHLAARPYLEQIRRVCQLHPAAVIVRDGKILAAACFLPKPSHEEDIDKNLGSRHRASLGISEVSDSVTIVVSEETGGISFAVNGRLIRNLSIEKLRQTLHFYLIPEAEETKEKGKKEKKAGFWKGRKK